MDRSSKKSELTSIFSQFNSTIKKKLKSFAIFLLLYYKIFYPIFIQIDEEEKIENIFPINIDKKNEVHYA